MPVFRDGAYEASLTMIYFAASMKQGQAIERYLDQLKATAASIGSELGTRRGDTERWSAKTAMHAFS